MEKYRAALFLESAAQYLRTGHTIESFAQYQSQEVQSTAATWSSGYLADAKKELVRALTALGMGDPERFKETLAEIRDRYIPDQPAAYNVPREDYLRSEYGKLRAIARDALELQKVELAAE